MVKARMRYTSGATEDVSCPLSLPSSFSSQIQVEEDQLDRRKVNVQETSAGTPVRAPAAQVSPWSLELCVQGDGLSLPNHGSHRPGA